MKIKSSAYAKALYEIAKAEGQVEQANNDFRSVVDTVGEHLKLKDSLTNPRLAAAQKQQIVEEIFRDKVSAIALGFLQLLISVERIEYLRLVSDELTQLIQIEEKKVIADVTTAIPLDENMSNKLAKRLSELTGKEVRLRKRVDETILGGIVIRIDGKLIDGSLRTKLEDLKAKMVK